MRVAEHDMIVGAKLRPGNTGFGEDDVPTLVAWIERVRAVVGPACVLVVRIDAAGDCVALLDARVAVGVPFVIKAKLSPALVGALTFVERWRTVDRDAFDRPTRQVAFVPFRRPSWPSTMRVRVAAVRTSDVVSGRQIRLWDDNDFSVQTYLTNDFATDEDDLARTYNDRAGIEPLFADLKNSWAIGRASGHGFRSNHAAFLVKLLAYNLLRRFVAERHPQLRRWRTPWLRRLLILRPGRIAASGRGRSLRLAPLTLPT